MATDPEAHLKLDAILGLLGGLDRRHLSLENGQLALVKAVNDLGPLWETLIEEIRKLSEALSREPEGEEGESIRDLLTRLTRAVEKNTEAVIKLVEHRAA